MKDQFFIEFLSILIWRLSFLTSELPRQPSVSQGGDTELQLNGVTKGMELQKGPGVRTELQQRTCFYVLKRTTQTQPVVLATPDPLLRLATLTS